MKAIILTPSKGREFGKGVKNLKYIGAKFDSASKTWSMPVDKWDATRPADRYHITVTRRPTVQHDQACDAYYDATAPCECHEII